MWASGAFLDYEYGPGQQLDDAMELPECSSTSSQRNEEVTCLYHDISRIDSIIRQLHEERASRCRRLNEIQSPATKLPTHILAIIFDLVCPHSQYNSSHPRVRRTGNKKSLVLPIFALCAVSSSWRRVALSTPQFWAKLDWQGKYHLAAEDAAALLQTYFARAAALPLDLKLAIDEKWEIEDVVRNSHPGEVDRHLNALKRTVFLENSHRIGSLQLDAPLKWLHLVSKSFTLLSDLSLHSVRIDNCVDLSNLPSLQRVTFMNMKVTPALPWKQIRVINLLCPHINVSLELLTRCVNLIEFHSQHPNPVRNENVIPHLKESITLQHLQWLDWSCISNSPWDDALFRSVHLPSLRRLSLTPGDSPSWTNEWENTLTNFLTRLPTTIELELGYTRDSSSPSGSLVLSKGGGGDAGSLFVPVLKGIFHALPGLKKLTLLEDDHVFIEGVVNLLMPPPLPPSPSSSPPASPSSLLPGRQVGGGSGPGPKPQQEHVVYLPALRTLCLKSGDREYTKDGVFTRLRGVLQDLQEVIQGDLFVALIKQRREVFQIPAFRLELNFAPQWSLKSREELRALVAQGLQLEVVEKSSKVDWLRVKS